MSEPAKRGRGRPSIPPEQQRIRLFEAAERCFERARLDSVSIEDIVHEAGMSKRSFYALFENKEQLVIELAVLRGDDFLSHLENVISEADTLRDAVDRSLADFLDFLPYAIFDLERMSGSGSARVHEIRNEYRAKIAAALGRQIAGVVAAGLIPIAAMPNPLALMVVLSGLEGFAVRFHVEGRREELRELRPQLLAALESLFPDLISDAIQLPK